MWTVFILTWCISISFAMTLALCLCWRKKEPKNDLLGLDGMVIQKNPDENVNHLPANASCVAVENLTVNASDTVDFNKTRSIPPTTTRRSLPDIPSEQGNSVSWEPSGDNSSEHYATVGQFHNVKRHTFHNGVENRPSISQHSSISQADDATSPYEKVKYDKVKAKEHPYAQLQPSTCRQITIEENTLTVEERISLLRPEGPAPEPLAPPRSRRSSTHSGVDIPAASAVAGGIAASVDLPYMTPPVTQANFSGDSQDSSKGYTSISVREPLASIMAQTKEMAKKRDLDQHYSTVSDDSDDVYTTIPDPNNQIYTSESETYARIPAHPITVEAEVNPTPSRCIEEAYQPPPPSVNSLKQVASHSHSRQGSCSSAVINIGSPKPEKRQANSPLPPPPLISNNRSVDELYAKVHKNKRKEESEDDKITEKQETDLTIPTTKDCDPGYEKIRNEEPGYASIPNSDPGYEILKQRDPNYEELQRLDSNASDLSGYSKIKYSTVDKKSSSLSNSQDFSTEEPNYESMPSEELCSEHNYAALKSTPGSESDPNYESVNDMDPPYERLKENFNKLKGLGYEHLDTSESSNGDGRSQHSGPPYEVLDNDLEVPGYEKVKAVQKQKNGLVDEEDGIFQV